LKYRLQEADLKRKERGKPSKTNVVAMTSTVDLERLKNETLGNYDYYLILCS